MTVKETLQGRRYNAIPDAYEKFLEVYNDTNLSYDDRLDKLKELFNIGRSTAEFWCLKEKKQRKEAK